MITLAVFFDSRQCGTNALVFFKWGRVSWTFNIKHIEGGNTATRIQHAHALTYGLLYDHSLLYNFAGDVARTKRINT